ncbi:hypothetical protein H5410_056137 [Solanum commersonii]|uniref:Uncharacterized protein n=1 Tax=Solanum commersonii TaxID=4109 RepID=A0A9J5WJF8_SOLCO|nr:hypothetical protein H5410_056137 [Solanum commersonii]
MEDVNQLIHNGGWDENKLQIILPADNCLNVVVALEILIKSIIIYFSHALLQAISDMLLLQQQASMVLFYNLIRLYTNGGLVSVLANWCLFFKVVPILIIWKIWKRRNKYSMLRLCL